MKMAFDELIDRAKKGEIVGGGHEQIAALLLKIKRLERENRHLRTHYDTAAVQAEHKER